MRGFSRRVMANCFDATVKNSFPLRYIFSALLVLVSSAIANADVDLLSEAEAQEIVQAEEAAKLQRKAAINAEVEAATVEEEFQHQQGSRKIVLRRVKPPVKTQSTELESDIEAQESKSMTLDQTFDLPIERFEMIQLNAKNYDELYSEITFRDGNTKFTIWTNVALNYLQGIGSFTFDGVRYDYFGFIDNISSELEQENVENWQNEGHAYKSRWKEPPVVFSEDPEYVVITEDPTLVPEILYEQTTALLTHYLSEQDNLRIAYLNRQKMSEARAKYRAENPETPEDSVMLFWPKENSRYLENPQ